MTDDIAAPVASPAASRPYVEQNPWQTATGTLGILLLAGGVIALFVPAGLDTQGTIDLSGLFVKDFVGTAAVTLGTVLVGVWVLIGAMEWRAQRPVGR